MNLLTNSRIALSIASIAAAAALVVGATFAFFSDTATSANNTFAAGTLSLQLDDNNEEASDTVTDSIQFTNLLPGVDQTGFISLHVPANSADVAEVEFGANVTGGNNGNGDGSIFADVLNLTVKTGSDENCATNQVDRTGDIEVQVGNLGAPLTLSELAGSDYDALPGLNSGETYFLCLTATVDQTAGNNYQGDSITADFVFTGNQNVSQ